jgi:dTDP-4-dehydrorhamnose reductase
MHTAAVSKPDLCEQRKSDAFAVNALGAQHIASAAKSVGAHLVHVSTDLVFDGEKNPYKTDAPYSPVNYYALTKVAAEAAVLAAESYSAIVRTTIIYGPRVFPFLESFSDKVIENLRAGKPMSAFTDQRRSPIPAWNLADACLEIAERRLPGVYHAACPESSTRYEFAVRVAEVFGLDARLIKPISMAEVQTLAFRPRDLILDTASTQAALRTHLLAFEEGILELRNRQDAEDAKREGL